MFTPKLQWIDETDPESIKQSRVHRQKEFHRAKRWKQVQQFQKEQKDGLSAVNLSREQSSSSSSVGRDEFSDAGTATSQSSPLLAEEASPLDDDADDDDADVVSEDRTFSPTRVLSRARRGTGANIASELEGFSDAHQPGSLGTKPIFKGSHLLGLLASSRRDPFGSLPFPGDSDAFSNQLVSHYLFDIPRIVYNVMDSIPNREVLFPLATLGPAAFQATLLVQAACHIAQLQGLSESVDSIEQMSKAIRLIQGRLNSPDQAVRTGDEVIAAVLSLADAENLFGFKDKAALHMQGVTAIIKQRGGYRSINKDRRLGIHMNWVNICLIRPSKLAELSSWSVYTFQSPHPISPPKLDLADFLSFLTNASLLPRLPVSNRYLIWRKRLFGPKSTIHRICSIPTTYDAWSTDLVPVYTRLAATMHISAALWEYRNAPTLQDRYLENLDRILVHYDFATSLSIGFLCYIVMKLDYDEAEQNAKLASLDPGSRRLEEEPEKRSWFVTRVLRVCKLLGKDSMIKVHGALLGFLDPTPVAPIDEKDDWIERLRQEIVASDTASAHSSSSNSPSGT